MIVSYNPSELFKPVSSCSVSTAKNHNVMYLAKYNNKQRCACIMLLLVSVFVRSQTLSNRFVILNVLRFVVNDNVNDCSRISDESLFIHSKHYPHDLTLYFAPEPSRTKCLVHANIELFYSSFAENGPTTSEPSSETHVSIFWRR